MKKTVIIFILLMGMFTSVFPDNKKEDLARVAILNFYDDTGTNDFGYMSQSIHDAILQSMHKKFEFLDVDEKAIKGKYPDSQPDKKKDEPYIKKSAKALKADIIIYGSYSFDKQTEQLILRPKILFVPIDEDASIKEVSNPVDNTIFQVTEKVSENIVTEINRMLDAYAKKSRNKEAIVSSEDKNKKVISKDSLETRGRFWAVGLTTQVIENSAWLGNIFFIGISGEQYLNNWLSTYGSLAYGYSFSNYYNYGSGIPIANTKGSNYLKVPAVGLIVTLASLLFQPDLVFTSPGILTIDGFSLNFKIGNTFQIAPFVGLNLAFSLKNISESLFGVEGGMRFNLYTSARTRASLYGGTYYNIDDKHFSYNAGLSFSYLTGK